MSCKVLGVVPVLYPSRWRRSFRLFLGCPMLLFPFGLHFNACLGILSLSILSTCCSRSLWCCFISRTLFCILFVHNISNQILVKTCLCTPTPQNISLIMGLRTVVFLAGRRLDQLPNPSQRAESPNTPVHIERGERGVLSCAAAPLAPAAEHHFAFPRLFSDTLNYLLLNIWFYEFSIEYSITTENCWPLCT
jgi:hypothetical protein